MDRVRVADKNDAQKIRFFVEKLAEYEKLSHLMVATEEDYEKWLFEQKTAEVFFAVEGEKEVGFALFFPTFSTFLGKGGIWLEDLFVLPEYRGKGYGKALLSAVARTAEERGCGRLEWSCLDWNEPSINFYLSLGAAPMDGWKTYRVSGKTLSDLAK